MSRHKIDTEISDTSSESSEEEELDDDTYIKSKNRRAHSDDEFSDSSSKNKSDSEDAETGSEKPTDENEGAETDSEKPTDENEGAETDSEKPTDENEDAETSSEKSGDENEDAETDSEKPTDENEDAETSSEKSADENEDVETGSEKPTDENEDAETSSEKSTSEDEDAETSSEKSADENEDVETGSEKPTDENEDAETSSEKSGDENEDAETGSEKSTSEDEDEGDDDGEENDEGEEMNLMAVAIKVAKGTELPFDQFKSIQKAAEESNDDWKKLHLKYIICAHASQHGGFIEPDYFGNLAELLNTDNMIIRQCIMWSFASILPCKNVLSPLLIRLLYKSLKDETLGWSISFLFRKMSEYDKYIPMITCSMWISMSKLLFDLTLSEQVRTTIIFTLNNVYKVRKWVAPIIKLRFEGSVQIDGIGTRVLVATVQALHSIALTGANLKKETVLRLRNLSNTADSSSMEVIHELLDFLDNKRVLSNASSYSGSGVKKELTATQNTSVSRSEEESVEPTMKLHSMDHLMNTVGHLGRTFNAESKPVDVIEGHNQAWYRTTWVEVSNLAALAKQGNLKDQDFDYLMTNFRDGPHWASTILSTKNDIFEMIAGAFRDAAEVKQAIPRNVLDVMIDRLSGTNNTIHRRCAQGLLFVLKNRQSFSEEQMNRIATKLKNTNDTEVKQNLIELYALYVSKGHHSKLDMDSIVDDLLNKETCETTSYLFFKAAAMEKRTFSKNIMKTLSKVAQSSKYGAEARDNCLWAIAYSIKHTEDKTSIHSAVIDTLGDLLVDPEKSVKQTAAIALCYYASDEKTVLPMDILERLAEMLNETDYGLLSNILSVYLRLSKQGEEIPETVVKRLGPVLYHEDYAIREKALWILKYTVDNQQKVKVKIIDQIDGCLNDSEFGIRNPAALIFIRYWTKQIQEKDGKLFQTLSGRMEKFMLIIFRHAFSLQVQQLSLDLLQSMVEKDFVLSETLIHLIECCLYDREETISKKSIDILRIYSKEHRLLPSTLICLEHLLTTETPIITNVILILKSIVTNGHRLSKKAIDILAQLLFKSSEPQEIITLLTHADRNQPISKSIDELLRQMYYGKILEHSTSVASLNKATKELFLSTNQGKPLSNYVLDLIIRKLNSIEQRATLMPILVNVVSNGQSLSKDHHRATLETMFFEMIDQPSIDLIEIFTHLTRQNQIISDRIIEQLEKYLREPSLNHFVIEIYQHLIERQKPLASKTIENIFHLFDRREWENLNDHSKHRLILFYKAVADNRPKETNQKYIPFLLGNGQSINTRKEICNSIRLLIKHRVELHLTTVDSLIRLIDNDDDPDLHQMALEILNCVRSTHTSINEDVSKFLDLLQCNDQTDDRTLIKNLKDGAKTNMNLPDRLLVRLSHMLYSCDLQLKQDAAMVLATIIPKGKTLPRQVIEVIYCTLFDGMINTKTLPLLLLHHNLEQPLPSSTISDLLYLTNRSPDESVRQCARNILENQMKNSATKIELFFEYLQSTSDIGGSKDLRQTLKMLRTVIIVEKQLSEEGLSLLVDHFSDEQQDEIIDVLLLASQYNIQFHQHQNLVRSIESALQKHPTPKLIQLIQILVHNAVIIQEQTLRILFDLMIRDNDNSALVAFEHASKRQALPPDILMYFIDLISNRSNEMFIAQRFSIIRQQISQGFVEDPLKTIEGIQFPSIIDVDQLKELDFTKERLGTIDTLLFITYFQEDVFKQPVKQWSRNCLCIEIIANCSNVTNDQIISFYQYLTQFEQLKHYAMFDEQRDIFLRHLIEKQRAESLSLSTVNDILIYATTLTATQLTILESNQIDWLMKMRSYYIEHQLTKCFQQCQYDKSLIDHLIQRIAEQEQLPAEFMSLCLQMIRSAEDVLNLLELFTSYAVNSTDLIEIFFQGETPADFETLQKKIRLLVVGKTLKSHWIGSNKNFSYARTLLQSLIQREWTIPKLLAILTATSKIKLSSNASESLIYLIDVLKILVDFNMDSNISSHLQSIFSETKIELWPSVAYHQAIEHHFGSSSSEKNLMTLLSELKQLNPQIDEKTLLNKYENIESSYKSDSSIMGRKKPIESWSKSMIQQWAKHVRQLDKSHQPTQFEMIAVMKRAVYLDSNFEPRPIQILAILIVLNARDQGGRLLQILTGEGKSTVVSMLAVFKALQNQQVDIITSSITLAKRDAHEQKTFYEYFNLTVAHNNDDTSYTSGPKSCYQADIVYGNSSQFQFDLLRHEFSLLNTRSLDKEKGLSRRFDAVIIDEVDSMLIDENNTLARLADQLPGMEWLNPLLCGIWRCIDSEASPASKRDNIIDNIRQLLSDPDSDLKLPTHLTDFVHESIPIWIDHAILAKVEYRLDHHYIIKPDESRTKRIMPIDFSNTGVVQPSTTWSDGLHQFLQIKHGLKMTTLTVTTNYLSNIGLFTRYGKNIFGLTGTIGSIDAQKLLDQIYHVDTIIIPPFKQKRHIQLNTVLTENDDEWLKKIVSETISHSRKQRCVLVICETRLDAKTISKQLQRADPTCLIRLYTDNTDAVESNVIGNRIQTGEIIVATNLAGRGTDLKTTTIVENNGGLHVCLTFLPNNLRVEEQAFGRTSRQGNRGTSQMILSRDRTLQQLMCTYPEYMSMQVKRLPNTIDLMRDWRKHAEQTHLERMWRDEIIDIKLKDELFQRFCKLLEKLRHENDNVYRLLSVKEQWGLWLKSMNYVTQNRLALRLFLERQGLKSEDVEQDGHSFFHALSQQIDSKLTSEEIKDQVIQHMIDNADFYKNVTEQERHQATSEALKINLIIYRTDSRSPHIYQREDAIHTCVLGYEVGSYYFSVQSSEYDDVANTMKQPEKQQKSKKQQFLDQCKRLADKSKRLIDQLKEEKDRMNKLLSTKIVNHDLRVGLNAFEKKMSEDYKKQDFIKNPCYLLMEADTIISQLSTWSNTARSWFEVLPWTEKQTNTYKDAIDRLEKAIELDPIFTFTAQVNRAHFIIDKEQSRKLYKTEAKSYLTKAQEILGKYILPQLHSMQLETKKSDDELIFDDLVNQTRLKVEILQIYQNYVGQAISTIEDSQKLTDVIVTGEDGTDRVTISKKLYRTEVKDVLDKSSGTVSLAFHSLKYHQDIFKHDQAVKLLKLFSEEDEKVCIRFLEGSKSKIEELEKIITSSEVRLNIEYLDSNEILPLIALSDRRIDLKLTATTDDYLQLIQKICELCIPVSKDRRRERKSRSKHERRIAEMNEQMVLITDKEQLPMTTDKTLKLLQDDGTCVESILFQSIEKEQAEFIISVVTKPSFTLTYHSMKLENLKEIVEKVQKPFNYELRDLSTPEAKKLIEQTTDRNFLLIIENLSVKRAKKINDKFNRNEQDVKTSLKRLTEHFPKSGQEYEELNAYGLLGISLLISIDELDPRPWISVTVVVALGVGQIVGGIYLTAVTGGLAINLGISLIGEGVNDIVFGVRGALSRRFSWKDYAIQKGVSLAICFASLGFSAVVQAVKGAQAVGVTGTTAMLRATGQGTMAIIKNSFRTVGSGAITGISSSSWLLAFKQVAVTCTETCARELANYFSDAAYQGILSEVKSKIHAEIEMIMQIHQKDEHYQRIFNRALTVDRYYEKDEWRNQIEQIAMNILTKNKDQFIETVQSLSKGITNAFLNHSRQLAQTTGCSDGYIRTAQLLITIGPMIKGANEIRTLTDSFFAQYKTELELLEGKMPTIEDLLLHASNQEFSTSTIKSITEALTEEKILTTHGLLDARFSFDNEEDADLSNPVSFRQSSDGSKRTPKDKLLHRLRKVTFDEDEHRCCAETVLLKIIGAQNHRSLRVSMFQKRIVDMLVDQVCAILYGTLVSPMMNYVISTAISSLSTAAQLKLNPDGTVMEQLMEEGAKRYIHGIANDLVEKYHKGELEFDPEAKAKLDKLVERCEKEGEEPANMMEQLALNVKNGKQGGVIELCAMAMLTKKPITVLQQELAGEAQEDNGSIRMVYKAPTMDKETGKIIDGHYELVGGTTAEGGPNDCMYTAIMSKLKGQYPSVDAMRTQCAAFILTNPNFIAGIHPALSIIDRTRNPIRRKELLGEGGAKPQDNTNPANIPRYDFERAKDLKDAKDKLIADMEKYIDESIKKKCLPCKVKDQIILALKDKDSGFGNFHDDTNIENKAVEMHLTFDIEYSSRSQNPTKLQFEINADHANDSVKYVDPETKKETTQPDHFGGQMYIPGMEKKATHKHLEEGHLQSRRLGRRTSTNDRTTHGSFEIKGSNNSTYATVTWTKTIKRNN